jgi:hypothetical protein
MAARKCSADASFFARPEVGAILGTKQATPGALRRARQHPAEERKLFRVFRARALFRAGGGASIIFSGPVEAEGDISIM